MRLNEAIELCRESCVLLESHGIPVIRIGVMSSPSLRREGEILAGPWHDAFGFLVRSRIHLHRIVASLPKPGKCNGLILRVPATEIPLIRGYRNQGLCFIEKKTGATVTQVIPDETIPAGQIAVETI